MFDECPADWKLKTLEDVCEVLDRFRVPLNSTERAIRQGNIPYWGANGIVDFIDEAIFNEPLLLMPEDGGPFSEAREKPICHLLDGPAWVNNHAHVLKVVHGLREYVYYWFVHRDITPFLKGGGRAKLNQADMRQLPILLPPLPEQQRIAEILSSVDESIRATKAVIAQAERVKQCLVDQFATGKSHFQPDYWVKISDIALINPRTSLVRGKVYPFIEMANLPIGSPDILRIEEKEFSNGGAKFAVGDTLFARITPCTENGKLGFVSELQTESVAFGSTEFIVLRPKDNKVRPKLIYYYCYSNHVRQKAIQKMIGSTGRQRVPNHVFDEIQVPVYSPQSQSVFEDTFGSLDDQITTNRATVEQLQRLKRGLMDDLLTGKVRTVA